jgi:hypothetical protein
MTIRPSRWLIVLKYTVRCADVLFPNSAVAIMCRAAAPARRISSPLD